PSPTTGPQGTLLAPVDTSWYVVATRTSSNPNCAVSPPISIQSKWIPSTALICLPLSNSAWLSSGGCPPGAGSSHMVTLVTLAVAKSNRITTQCVFASSGVALT